MKYGYWIARGPDDRAQPKDIPEEGWILIAYADGEVRQCAMSQLGYQDWRSLGASRITHYALPVEEPKPLLAEDLAVTISGAGWPVHAHSAPEGDDFPMTCARNLKQAVQFLDYDAERDVWTRGDFHDFREDK